MSLKRNNTPILYNENWRYLIRDLATQKGLSRLPEASHNYLVRYLVPVTTAARVIATKMPKLVNRDPLRLLIVGAENVDCADYGRMYAFLPYLIGSKGTTETTIVGKKADPNQSSIGSFLIPTSTPKATVVRKNLSDFLRDNPRAFFDVIFLFNPMILEFYDEWMNGNPIRELLARGPIAGSASSVEDYEIDRYHLEAFGFKISPAVDNPFMMENVVITGDYPRWGSLFWNIEPPGPPASFEPLQDRLDLFHALSNACSKNPVIPFYGTIGSRVKKAVVGGSKELLHLYPGAYLDEDTLNVLQGEDEYSEMVESTEAYALRDDMLGRPGDDATRLDRAIWAVSLFREILVRHNKDVMPGEADQAGNVL